MAARELTIRPMRREDIDAVMAIDRHCFPVPWSQNAFAAELGNASAWYLVAESEGRVCGYIGAWIVVDEVHVTTFGVDPSLRRQGVGERLLAALLQEGMRRGVRRASLEVRMSNYGAQQLYAKYGFAPVSRRFRYYTDNDEDALVMWIEDMTTPARRDLLRARFAALAQATWAGSGG